MFHSANRAPTAANLWAATASSQIFVASVCLLLVIACALTRTMAACTEETAVQLPPPEQQCGFVTSALLASHDSESTYAFIIMFVQIE